MSEKIKVRFYVALSMHDTNAWAYAWKDTEIDERDLPKEGDEIQVNGKGLLKAVRVTMPGASNWMEGSKIPRPASDQRSVKCHITRFEGEEEAHNFTTHQAHGNPKKIRGFFYKKLNRAGWEVNTEEFDAKHNLST